MSLKGTRWKCRRCGNEYRNWSGYCPICGGAGMQKLRVSQ